MVKDKRLLILGAGGFLLLLIVGGLLFSYQKAKTSKVAPAVVPPTYTSPEEPIPTLSEEEKQIISTMQTHTILIEQGGFSPATLTIKVHDQVRWSNKTQEDFQVKGEGWGNLVLSPGKNYMREFDSAGTFSYSCVLHPQFKGQIIVEE